ncbi:glutamate synthase (NADH) small subunit [Clostridium sp. USBA 49]|uniref:glutamate synthase subunit beta n=1 Tax=Clostridium sp. USBA 49 TaxID=1881060 RepID=UPI0009995CB8|nr:glutamate synthase subunit beta [Clostridium sp. USBA 49]SKA78481.1 glutamate synthase (NADH) small subunit [Clostridium sp. USBA 49]
MGKVTGFKEYKRETSYKRPIEERIKDYKEVKVMLPEDKLKIQGARCMNCGTPFCNYGCPLGNLIPDYNNMVYLGQWEKAYKRLSITHPFPEFTGRVCPALCEGSCTLGINREAVAIEDIELAIIEKAYEKGWVKPNIPRVRTGKKVAVIGSGPSGLAVSVKLNSYGHKVTVFEKDDAPGGLLRYGIPDFKLEKNIIDRRISIMEEEGIIFKTNCEIGKDYSLDSIRHNFDAVILTGGCQVPRNLNIEGRELDGIYYAMEYLTAQNRKNAGKELKDKYIDAKGKVVVVIGGGDTGSDCIGTARRQGAKEIYQYEILPKPPISRDDSMPWPEFPRTLKTSTSHEEGCIRKWCITTKRFEGKNGKLTKLYGAEVRWDKDENGKFIMTEIQGSEFEQDVDLVLIAMGFSNPIYEGMLKELDIKLDNRGNVYTDENYMTSVKGIFAAGDMRTGQSLVVRAISDGLKAAESVDKYLMK